MAKVSTPSDRTHVDHLNITTLQHADQQTNANLGITRIHTRITGSMIELNASLSIAPCRHSNSNGVTHFARHPTPPTRTLAPQPRKLKLKAEWNNSPSAASIRCPSKRIYNERNVFHWDTTPQEMLRFIPWSFSWRVWQAPYRKLGNMVRRWLFVQPLPLTRDRVVAYPWSFLVGSQEEMSKTTITACLRSGRTSQAFTNPRGKNFDYAFYTSISPGHVGLEPSPARLHFR
ncbi:uncharacterized protein LACBIDRAFT_330571 [Laccaria bicolor S238N-H82]|uniref:Predicted protein n=1 Tax=Laccaria bicolor (strain S238N-H82 / ATCC MYA-4686) TaxID=486041 RepID=B0DLR4_LACBS|nr:uncharacterized protein LACBIDRAFT_330571 [Laccaria bicolor S238N-H82]EDR04439.1 predicted protein [Laccaria bicolor S238N-H82]|eukprot:XP_001884958.1 predicted protein [Laccaria bicolor S238N-H82]